MIFPLYFRNQNIQAVCVFMLSSCAIIIKTEKTDRRILSVIYNCEIVWCLACKNKGEL